MKSLKNYLYETLTEGLKGIRTELKAEKIRKRNYILKEKQELQAT